MYYYHEQKASVTWGALKVTIKINTKENGRIEGSSPYMSPLLDPTPPHFPTTKTPMLTNTQRWEHILGSPETYLKCYNISVEQKSQRRDALNGKKKKNVSSPHHQGSIAQGPETSPGPQLPQLCRTLPMWVLSCQEHGGGRWALLNRQVTARNREKGVVEGRAYSTNGS